MNPSLDPSYRTFSSCTQNIICTYINSQIISRPQCFKSMLLSWNFWIDVLVQLPRQLLRLESWNLIIALRVWKCLKLL
jgi:hypothetical protein